MVYPSILKSTLITIQNLFGVNFFRASPPPLKTRLATWYAFQDISLIKPHILFNGDGPAIWHDFPVITYKKAKLYFTLLVMVGGGPRVVVSTAAFHARVRGSVPGLGGLKETKLFLPHPRVKVSIVGSLRDREVACSASDRQGSNFESCVWRTVSSQSSHHPQEVLLAQFSLYVHKGGLKPDSFHFLLWS